MRRTSLIPNQVYIPVSGKKSMREIKTILGSRAMLLEDTIRLDSRDIIYFQQLSGEQVSLSQEINTGQNIYSLIQDKKSNHTLELVDNSWILKINHNEILINYLFSQIKASRSFGGVLNNQTKDNNVSLAIIDYINLNILDKYEISKVDLFLEYKSLEGTDRFLKNNIYNNKISKRFDSFFFNINDQDNLEAIFNQTKDVNSFNFDYYFNIILKKINKE